MWPDTDAADCCDMRTLIDWNLWLPEPITLEEKSVWLKLRNRLLLNTCITTVVSEGNTYVQTTNLLALQESKSFDLNLFEPYTGKLDDVALNSIINYYLEVNTLTRGFLSNMIKLIVKDSGYDHAKSIIFPHIQNIKHAGVETLFKFDI